MTLEKNLKTFLTKYIRGVGFIINVKINHKSEIINHKRKPIITIAVYDSAFLKMLKDYNLREKG